MSKIHTTNCAPVCKICNVRVSSGNFPQHNVGRKHLSLLPQFISIENLPPDINLWELHTHFASFGNIIKHEIKKKAIKYVFEDKTSYSKVIQLNHVYRGKRLKVVFKRKSLDSVSKTNIKTTVTTGEETSDSISSQPKNTVSCEKQANDSSSENLMLVADVVEEKTSSPTLSCVSQERRQTKIISMTAINWDENNFTSISKHLNSAIKTYTDQSWAIVKDLSDILCKKSHFQSIKITPLIKSTLNFENPVLLIHVSNFREMSQLNEAQILENIFDFLETNQEDSNLRDLKLERLKSVVEFYHTKTEILCHISVSNYQYETDYLLKTILNSPRVRDLINIIQFWAECQSLKQSHGFSDYIISLLVIFYLQQEPSTPNSIDIRNLINKQPVEFAISRKFKKWIESLSLFQLISGFFKFYNEFDFTNEVICPYFGAPIEKNHFLIYNSKLPKSYRKYDSIQSFKTKLTLNICIEDPLDRAENICADIALDSAFYFIKSLANMCSLISEEKINIKKLFETPETPIRDCFVFIIRKSASVNLDHKTWAILVKNVLLKAIARVFNCLFVENLETSAAFSIECTGNSDIWENRLHALKFMTSSSVKNSSKLDEEISITEHLINILPKSGMVSFTLNVTFRDFAASVEMVDSEQKCDNFACFYYFLKCNFPKWILEEEKEAAKSRFEDKQAALDIESKAAIMVKIEDEGTRKPVKFTWIGKNGGACAQIAHSAFKKSPENRDAAKLAFHGNCSAKNRKRPAIDFEISETSKRLKISNIRQESLESKLKKHKSLLKEVKEKITKLGIFKKRAEKWNGNLNGKENSDPAVPLDGNQSQENSLQLGVNQTLDEEKETLRLEKPIFDYLNRSLPQNESPKKLAVLNKCEKVVEFLSQKKNISPSSGRFVIAKSEEIKSDVNFGFLSPLKKKRRFIFHNSANDCDSAFTKSLRDISRYLKSQDPFVSGNKCWECAQYNAKKYQNAESQCDFAVLNKSTQVTENDLVFANDLKSPSDGILTTACNPFDYCEVDEIDEILNKITEIEGEIECFAAEDDKEDSRDSCKIEVKDEIECFSVEDDKEDSRDSCKMEIKDEIECCSVEDDKEDSHDSCKVTETKDEIECFSVGEDKEDSHDSCKIIKDEIECISVEDDKGDSHDSYFFWNVRNSI